jgi:hypothetical protein
VLPLYEHSCDYCRTCRSGYVVRLLPVGHPQTSVAASGEIVSSSSPSASSPRSCGAPLQACPGTEARQIQIRLSHR